MSKPLRIGIVDDIAVNRSSISNKIKQFEDLAICLMAVNGNDCLEQLKGFLSIVALYELEPTGVHKTPNAVNQKEPVNRLLNT